jgi:hypothetical protein
VGLALTRRCTLRAVAEALAWVGKSDTVERQLRWFSHNPCLDWQTCLPVFSALKSARTRLL